MVAIGILTHPRTQKVIKMVNTIPILNPDTTAISLLLFVSLRISGYTTVTAHITFAHLMVEVLRVLPNECQSL
jgi:hypothetical protein